MARWDRGAGRKTKPRRIATLISKAKFGIHPHCSRLEIYWHELKNKETRYSRYI